LDEKHFKSYDDLKKKFEMVMGLNGGAVPGKRAEEIDLGEQVSAPKQSFAPKTEKAPVKAPAKEVDFEDDEESLSYFAKLAED
jgi:hypothetical protein